LQAGADNGSGTIKVDSLLRGEYAFANIQQSVGLEDVEEETYFHLYPNPSSETVYIDTEITGRYSVELFDLTGKLIYQTNDILDRNVSYAVDISGIEAGKYDLVIKSLNGRFVESLGLIKE
jgi:hypothetical protein